MVSVATYVACGSNDDTRTAQEAGAGGLGEGGGDPSGGGSKSTAGSKNNGGNLNVAGADVGGAAGESGAGASAGGTAGSGGAAGEGGGSSGGEAGASGGAGGAPEVPDFTFPAACPGPAESYTTLTGTSEDDMFTTLQLDGKVLAFGSSGNDDFGMSYGGDDCLVGGPGDDNFSSSNEGGTTTFVGGSGVDTFHIEYNNDYIRIADMESGDKIALNVETFQFLTGNSGDVPAVAQVVSVPDYSAGTGMATAEASCIVYDPKTGELWRDTDGYTKGSSPYDAQRLGQIINFASYTFDLNDFELD